jgi:hypothetical protein
MHCGLGHRRCACVAALPLRLATTIRGIALVDDPAKHFPVIVKNGKTRRNLRK